jgi:hypothetical protein
MTGTRLIVGGALAVAVLTVAEVPAAIAAASRVAVVIGNNRAAGKGALRHAERDARRIRDVLKEIGGVQQAKLLLGRSADDLRQALVQLQRNAATSRKEVVLFLYYSGHADRTALLMGGSRLPFKELRSTLTRFPARTAISFIDACQSGQVTRTKGGRVVPVVDVRFEDQRYKGRVYVTSSSAGESAQESDELGASFFTHYLLSALRGAADTSGDGRVSLEEAYQYAYRHTLSRTAGTLQGPQHPSYDMDLAGAGQLVLTYTHRAPAHIVLPARARGTYFIQRPGSEMIAEVGKSSGRALRIALAPGRYEIRKVTGTHYLTRRMTVTAGRDAVLDESGMERRPLQLAVHKGEDGLRNGLRVTYHLSTGYLQQAGPSQGPAAGYLARVGPLHVGGLLAFSYGSYQRDDGIAIELQELTLWATGEWRLARWPRFQPLLGLDVGVAWVLQQADFADGRNERRDSSVFRYRARLGVLAPIWRGVSLGAWGHLGQVVVQRPEGWEAPLVGGFEAAMTLEL